MVFALTMPTKKAKAKSKATKKKNLAKKVATRVQK